MVGVPTGVVPGEGSLPGFHAAAFPPRPHVGEGEAEHTRVLWCLFLQRH